MFNDRFSTSNSIRSAILHQCQRTAHSGFGRDVQNHRCRRPCPLIRPSEMQTMSRTPCCNSFLGNPELPGFGHPGETFWADALQDQHAVFVHVEIGVVNPRPVVFYAFKHYGSPAVLHEFRARRPMA